MEQLLEQLFGSTARARLLRLFMQNQDGRFIAKEIQKRTQLEAPVVNSELLKFIKLGLTKQKVTRGTASYYINKAFPLLQELHDLVIKSVAASKRKLLIQIKRLGKVKLAVVSGIFLNEERSRTDLLLVADDISKRKLENFLGRIESEVGKPIQYTLMDVDEFKYRLNMYDRFLRDILEYPHEKLINRFDI